MQEQRSPAPARRVAAVGLDAMEWGLVERMLERGDLPNLAELRERSRTCTLKNTVEFRSELPYTQFLTGKTPAANGYWSTVAFDPRSYDAWCDGAADRRPFFALGDAKKVIQFDVPHSVLADDVDGVQITGWGCHSPQYPRAARPAGMLRQIDERFGAHPAWGNDSEPGWYEPDYLDALCEALEVGAERRVDASLWLQEQVPDWDLFLTVMSEPHSAGHHLWHGVEPSHPCHGVDGEAARERIEAVYRAVDAAVGRLVEGLPADTALVVFALHGMQPNENDVPSLVLLPELIHRLHHGRPLLRDGDEQAWRADGFPPLSPARHQRWIAFMQDAFVGGFRADPTHALRRLLPPRLVDLARRATGRFVPPPVGVLGWPVPEETTLTVEEIRELREHLRWQSPMWYRRFWARQPYFALPTFSDGHVRLNVAGREASGIVAPEDFRAVGEQLIEELRRCRNPRTGHEVLEDVIWTRSDPMDTDAPAPDFVLLWREPMDALEHPTVGTVGPYPFMRTGEHSSNGFAFVSGPGIAPGSIGQRSAFDVPPTIMDLLGAEPPADIQGDSLLRP